MAIPDVPIRALRTFAESLQLYKRRSVPFRVSELRYAKTQSTLYQLLGDSGTMGSVGQAGGKRVSLEW